MKSRRCPGSVVSSIRRSSRCWSCGRTESCWWLASISRVTASRLARLGLEVEIFENERLDQVLENIARLGKLLDREQAAAERIAAILGMRQAVARSGGGTRTPCDSWRYWIVHLSTWSGPKPFSTKCSKPWGREISRRGLAAGYPRGSIEWLIAAKPELLLDMTPGSQDGRAFWARWPSLPAVVVGSGSDSGCQPHQPAGSRAGSRAARTGGRGSWHRDRRRDRVGAVGRLRSQSESQSRVPGRAASMIRLSLSRMILVLGSLAAGLAAISLFALVTGPSRIGRRRSAWAALSGER